MDTLPTNSSEWPEDPYQLLGVDETATEQQVKSAYVKLIRLFKPEQCPNEFRRIRHAYETILKTISFGDIRCFQFHTDSDCASKQSDEQNVINSTWETAISGDLRQAYQSLAIEYSRINQAEIAICLYWLLSENRHLDSSKSPISWLIDALIHSPQNDKVTLLLMTEVENYSPPEFTEATEILLNSEEYKQHLKQLLPIRWRQLFRINNINTIKLDIKKIRYYFAIDDLRTWMFLLSFLLDWLLWEPQEKSLFVSLAKEIQSFDSASNNHLLYYIENCETLTRLHQSRLFTKTLLNKPEFYSILKDCYRDPEHCDRLPYRRMIESVKVNTVDWIFYFDQLGSEIGHLAPKLLEQFSQIESEQQSIPDISEEMALYIGSHLKIADFEYRHNRAKILSILITRRISIGLLYGKFSTIFESNVEKIPTWIVKTQEDMSMSLASRAIQLYYI